MKKISSLTLVLVALALLDLRCAQAGPLDILGVAAQYNVFLFGDLNLANTDVEGRAAARGDVTLTNFGIGTKVVSENGIPSLVAGGTVTLTEGSVGCQTAVAPGCTAAVEKMGTIISRGSLTVLGDPTHVTYGTATKPRASPRTSTSGLRKATSTGCPRSGKL